MGMVGNTSSVGIATGPMYNVQETKTSQTSQPTVQDAKKQADKTTHSNSSTNSVDIITSTSDLNNISADTNTAIIETSEAYLVEISQEAVDTLNQDGAPQNAQRPAAPSGAGMKEADKNDETESINSITNAVKASSNSSDKSAAETLGVSEDDSSDSSTTESLAQYSEAQLKQLLKDGKITQSQYNAEIVKRQSKSQTAEATSTITNADNPANL